MIDKLSIKDYRYHRLYIFILVIITILMVVVFVVLKQVPLMDGGIFSIIPYLFLPLPIFFIFAFIADTQKIPISYKLTKEMMILGYSAPFRRQEIIPIYQIKKIYYSQLYGVIPSFTVLIFYENKIKILRVVNSNVLRQIQSKYSPTLFQILDLNHLQELIRKNLVVIKADVQKNEKIIRWVIFSFLGLLLLSVLVWSLTVLSDIWLSTFSGDGDPLRGIAMIIGFSLGLISAVVTTIFMVRYRKKQREKVKDSPLLMKTGGKE